MAWNDLTNPEAWKVALANLLRKGEDVGQYVEQAPAKAGQAIVEAGQRQSALMNKAFDPTGKTLIRDKQAANEAAMNLLEGPLGIAPIGMTRADVLKQAFNDADIYKNIQEANKSTFPKIPVENIFKVSKGSASSEKLKSFDQAIEKKLDLPLKEIDLASIIPTQKNINFNNLKDVKDVKNVKDHILAIEENGKYYLMDGHHRIANEILKNTDKIKIKVFE